MRIFLIVYVALLVLSVTIARQNAPAMGRARSLHAAVVAAANADPAVTRAAAQGVLRRCR